MQTNIRTDNNELQIVLSDRLTFEDHEAFRDVIMAIKKNEQATCSIDLVWPRPKYKRESLVDM